jgi:threonine/homoserine/homoserine lactone efflux protein
MVALFLLVASTHFAALLSPGPDFFLLLRTALLQGRRQADGCASGIAAANGLVMLVVLLAQSLLPAEGGWVWRALQGVGGAYFVWLGLQAFSGRRQLALPEAGEVMAGRWWLGFVQGLAASVLNPKCPIFYAGLFGVLHSAAMPGWGLAVCMAWMATVVLVWDLALVRLLSVERWRLWLQRRVVVLDRVCGGLLLVLGVYLLWTAR